MAFGYTNSKDRTYYLHKKEVELSSNGRVQTIYFFAKDIRKDDSLDVVPEGYEVAESKNGLPLLKKPR